MDGGSLNYCFQNLVIFKRIVPQKIPGIERCCKSHIEFVFCTLIYAEMKKTIFILIITSLAFTSCKKTVENIQEDLVIKAMTDGEWKITDFTLNSNNITADFATYKFKYYSDKTVDAINNGTVEKKGTWDGDAPSRTTSANFTGATQPLSLINGSWYITKNSWTYVEARQTNGSDTKTMRLDKL